jgi:hypothetical protein
MTATKAQNPIDLEAFYDENTTNELGIIQHNT